MTDQTPGSWRGVVNRYHQCSEDVQEYFKDIPDIIRRYDWDVVIGFMFIRLERAFNTMLYRGAIKIHRAHAETAFRFVDQHHMKREGFHGLFRNVFGAEIPKDLINRLKDAEKIRNKVIHGKTATAPEQRKAIVQILAYAEGMNEFVHKLAEFKPFKTDQRGIVGRREPLDESTTAWLMRGIGFTNNSGDGDSVS